ncbi:MAG: hypothetical protein E6J20_02225 [Chloroflexi bacterium]|nr:MAG: hypothetical protein E6J20_02225 [Chloroflexota bacterium]
MNLLNAANIARLLPGAAVAGVLALSFMTPVSTQASNLNNCGVKGYGYHDHGKPCPNRPFPGQGKGLEHLATGSTSTPTTSQETVTTNNKTVPVTVTTGTAISLATKSDSSGGASGKNHAPSTERGRNHAHRKN